MDESKKNDFQPGDRISRRRALKIVGFGTAAICLPGSGALLFRGGLKSSGLLMADEPSLTTAAGLPFGPIDRTVPDIAPKVFSGDNADRSHHILWDKAGYVASKGGKMPMPSEQIKLAVIGGGLSGCFTSYLLKDYNPVIFERAERFGGNARGESWHGSDYSIGSAYFVEQEPGSPLDKLYTELGIKKMVRVKTEEDSVIYNGKQIKNFWDGETVPEAERSQFHKLRQYFVDLATGQNGQESPDIPPIEEDKRAQLNLLDQLTFKEKLEQVAGGKLHPHIETAIEHYCWSSFGASMTEISAASGLNFYAGEFGKIYVAPGGNSAVCERLLHRLSQKLPKSCFRPNSVVFDVKVVDDGVIVTYSDANDELKAVHAEAVVMSCPKFVVSRILNGIESEPDRMEAIRRLRYRSYLVCNVLLNQPMASDFYDLFMIGDGSVNLDDIATESDKVKATDFVLGTYAKSNTSHSILTLYRALPYDGARSVLLGKGAYDKYRAEFQDQIETQILPLVGIDKSKIADMRVTRWGHPIPVADRGLIRDGTVDILRRPFGKRVFFVEQDNWMLPCMETGATEAVLWAPKIEQLLKEV